MKSIITSFALIISISLYSQTVVKGLIKIPMAQKAYRNEMEFLKTPTGAYVFMFKNDNYPHLSDIKTFTLSPDELSSFKSALISAKSLHGNDFVKYKNVSIAKSQIMGGDYYMVLSSAYRWTLRPNEYKDLISALDKESRSVTKK